MLTRSRPGDPFSQHSQQICRRHIRQQHETSKSAKRNIIQQISACVLFCCCSSTPCNALKAIKGEILSMDNPMTRNRSSSLERFHCFQELDSTCPRRPSGELDLTRVVTFSQVRVKRGVLRNMASRAVASLEPDILGWESPPPQRAEQRTRKNRGISGHVRQ